MSGKRHTTRVNLSETEREALLDRLDQQQHAESGQSAATKANRRRHKRWNYREANVTVSVEHPAGGVSRFLVCARNLSAGGVGFIHSGYLHKGSSCQVELRALDGQMRSIAG